MTANDPDFDSSNPSHAQSVHDEVTGHPGHYGQIDRTPESEIVSLLDDGDRARVTGDGPDFQGGRELTGWQLHEAVQVDFAEYNAVVSDENKRLLFGRWVTLEDRTIPDTFKDELLGPNWFNMGSAPNINQAIKDASIRPLSMIEIGWNPGNRITVEEWREVRQIVEGGIDTATARGARDASA